jgi:hypothetical protein
LEMVVARPRAKWVVIAILAALLIGWHVRYTNDFVRAWSTQVGFYRQWLWRVPAMRENTALMTDRNIFAPADEFPGSVAVDFDFPMALAVNVLHGSQPQGDGRLPYWFFFRLDDRMHGSRLYDGHIDSYFSGDTQNSLPFTFAPENGACLHILGPEQAVYRDLPDGLKQLAASGSLAAIDVNAATNSNLPDAILGAQDTNTWCYFYEKADLARQKQDWPAVTALWDSADKKGLRPGNGFEYLPFVEAAIRLKDWDQALTLTRTANKISTNMGDLYCPLWEKLAGKKNRASRSARILLECGARRP